MSRLSGPTQEETVQVKTKRPNSEQEENVRIKRKEFIVKKRKFKKKTTSRVSEDMELEMTDHMYGELISATAMHHRTEKRKMNQK